MSLLLDTQYLNRLSYKLQQFKKIAENTYNFRCPICGDSKTKKNLKRGYVFKNNKKDALAFKCHNCEASMGFHFLLKTLDEVLYKEYVFSNINNYRNIPSKKQEKKIKEEKSYNYQQSNKLEKFKKKLSDNKYYTGLINIYKLDNEHIAKKYLINRKITDDKLKLFYYCEDFCKYINNILPNKFTKPWIEPRLIIPLISSTGELFGVQGRSLDPLVDKRFRYITIIFDSEYNKTFGCERINSKKQIIIVEGPFDSVFIDNCIAACGASIDSIVADVYILDNEPRNKNIINIMKKLISKGKSIVILPEKYQGMDINDLIITGQTENDIKKLIEKYTVNGLRANIILNNWKRI